VELTVCYETNFEPAQSRKEEKYEELVEQVENNGYAVDLVIIEVGSKRFRELQKLPQVKRSIRSFRSSYYPYHPQ
jgi:hypothetical protein